MVELCGAVGKFAVVAEGYGAVEAVFVESVVEKCVRELGLDCYVVEAVAVRLVFVRPS